MTIEMLQGASYPIFINLKQDGKTLTPYMLSDLEVCVGEELRYTYSGGTLHYDASRHAWYIWPTQEQTIASEGSQDVYARPKYPNTPAELYPVKLGRIRFKSTSCKEVL